MASPRSYPATRRGRRLTAAMTGSPGGRQRIRAASARPVKRSGQLTHQGKPEKAPGDLVVSFQVDEGDSPARNATRLLDRLLDSLNANSMNHGSAGLSLSNSRTRARSTASPLDRGRTNAGTVRRRTGRTTKTSVDQGSSIHIKRGSKPFDSLALTVLQMFVSPQETTLSFTNCSARH